MILPPPPADSVPVAPQRDAAGRWLPGTPSPCVTSPGRPVVAAEVKKLARSYGQQAILTLVNLMLNAADERVRKSAADSLLDRGYGRPVQQIEAGAPGAFENVEDAELRQIVMREAALLIAGTSSTIEGESDDGS